jgi:3-oxoacyl-[acyl-carrier-protein] synthase II
MAEASEARRVLVTGMGAITAQGASVDEFWLGVRNGHVAIVPVRHLPMEGYRTKIGGEVQQDVKTRRSYLNPSGFHDRAIDFTLIAAEEAMEDCGVGVGAIPAERWGIVVGTCNAGLLAGELWYSRRLYDDPTDPRLAMLVPPQAFSEALSGAFGIRGPVLSVNTACAASANAIGWAAQLIQDGHADAVLTGGTDAFSDVLFAGFHSLESLSPEPAAPYSRDRQGLSLGEGSGMMVLMNDDAAREHDARVRAEVLGYGLSADGYHPTAPHPEGRGAARAIKTALAQGGVSPHEVAYVNSHGTGTPKNDSAETAATKAGLGEDAARAAAVSSTKSMIGHLLGGAGGVEAIITVKALESQTAPPTANYREPDPECDLDYVPNEPRELAMDVAVSNNFAFGGANASVVFARQGARSGPPPAPRGDRVVVTGLGTLTAAGTTPGALWDAYASGRDCTEAQDDLRVARVDLTPSEFLSPKERKRVDRIGLFSVIASRLALADAGLELTDDNRERVGAIVGTGVGPMESMEAFAAPVMREGARSANPAVFPNTVYNAAGGQVAIKVGAVGSASTVTAGHAAGASALCYGFDLAAGDHADAMLCLGADALTDTVLAAYAGLGLVADGGDGFALGEAGIALVAERLGAAQARGARVYGEILGYAITADGLGIGRVDADGTGIERAMRLALERSGVGADDVAAIWGLRCGLRIIDDAETKAIERLFADPPPLLAPKLRLGEPLGAGGALSAALALTGWERGDEEASPRGPILVNSSSLGGTNFSIVLAPPE